MAKDKTRLLHVPCFRTLACLAGIALATGLRAAPLTTAAELAAVNRGENTEADGFAITATLVRVCSPEKTDSLCVSDCSGYTTLRLPFNLRPAGLAAGCSLRLSGGIDYEAQLAPAIVATNCVVIAEGPAPTPRDVSIREVHSGKFDFQLVRATAVLHDAFRDEIDKGTTFLVLMQGRQTLYAALPNEYLTEEDFAHLIGATVSITGICDAFCGTSRRYRGRTVNPTEKGDIAVIEPSAKDIFSEPDISELKLASPDQLHAFGRHTAKGRVVAVWDNSSILVRRANGEFVTILSAQDGLPRVGETIIACGFPETDLYTITLTRAAWKKISDVGDPMEVPTSIAMGAVLKSVEFADLADAIRKVAAGETVVDDEIKRILKTEPAIEPLSARQREILEAIVNGLSNAEISTLFGISLDMVKEHNQKLFEKLGVTNRTEAVAITLRKHLLKI